MNFIEKHKALILTTMIMGIFVLSLYNINMFNKQKEQAEILLEIPEDFLEQLEKIEEPKEEELLAQETRQIDAAKRTHNAYNEDFEDDEEFEKRMKSLTESKDTEDSADKEDEAENEESEIPMEKVKKAKSEAKEVNNRNSSLTYNLKNRKAIDLPNPVYTCNGSGKVVVKIEVNKNGYVVNTKVDKRKSTTRNECLFDNAMDYARQALFSRNSVEKQEGTITYYFNYRG